MKVSNMISASGNSVANQFVVEWSGNRSFHSYDSNIVQISSNGSVALDRDNWNYSRTTSKYRNQFLNETTVATQAKIDSGEYVLADLN
jgi:hypothetical protein